MKIRVNKNLFYALITILVSLLLFTASFDIVGVINLGGFNFRISQVFAGILILMWLLDGIKNGFRKPVGVSYLVCWIVLQAFFVLRSPNLYNAVGYYLWLLFDVLTVFVMVQFVGRAYSVNKLVKIYMESFVWAAILGLVQQALFIVGIDFFVAQHWNEHFARINGFCYEPSYYSTYLLPGFVVYAYLFETHNIELFSRKSVVWRLLIVSVALIFSTSRMGWLMMATWILFRAVISLYHMFKKGISIRRLLDRYLLVGIVLGVILIGISFVRRRALDLRFLFNGLGLFDQATHSSASRFNGLIECIELFLQNPWLGISLGGVDPFIAQHRNIIYSTQHNGLGTSIIGEALLANGIVGLIPFIGYFISLIFLGKKRRSAIHKAVIWAFIFEIGILCFNQNILRIYVWCLIGVLSSVEYSERSLTSLTNIVPALPKETNKL